MLFQKLRTWYEMQKGIPIIKNNCFIPFDISLKVVLWGIQYSHQYGAIRISNVM